MVALNPEFDAVIVLLWNIDVAVYLNVCRTLYAILEALKATSNSLTRKPIKLFNGSAFTQI